MNSFYVLVTQQTQPILPPLFIEKNYGRHYASGGTFGDLLLVSGDPDSIVSYIEKHQQIWLGFHDTTTPEHPELELWSKPRR